MSDSIPLAGNEDDPLNAADRQDRATRNILGYRYEAAVHWTERVPDMATSVKRDNGPPSGRLAVTRSHGYRPRFMGLSTTIAAAKAAPGIAPAIVAPRAR